MKQLLLFSDAIKPLIATLKFVAVVVWRFVRLTFKRNRQISTININALFQHSFSGSYLVVKYNIPNALWFDFFQIKKTTKNGTFIFDLKNAATDTLSLVVYGWFRKKIIRIKINPTNSLRTESFRTAVKGNTSVVPEIPTGRATIGKANVEFSHTSLVQHKILINHSPLNTSDFL
jgi:hypothetical protein